MPPSPTTKAARTKTDANSEDASFPTTNRDTLVSFAVAGTVTHPITSRHGYDITREGRPVTLPGVGGIVYSHFVGDPCVGLAADHIEPGASISNFSKDWGENAEKNALNVYAQVGNTAIVATGDAKGCIGTVAGKHGGVEHVIVHFPAEVLERMDLGDRVRIRAYGAGLTLTHRDDIILKNMDPRLWERLSVVDAGTHLEVPVAKTVPAAIMGSGLGADNTNRGDYDIQLSDPEIVKRHGLEELRFGDLVAIEDADASFGRSYRQGAITIGVVVHSDSHIAGHGPGVTTLMASTNGAIRPRIDDGANLASILGLSRESPGDHHDARFLKTHQRALEQD